MLLRASGDKENQSYNLAGVIDTDTDSGVAGGYWLRKLAEAVAHGDWIRLGHFRADAEDALGQQKVVDALVVASAFNGITRVADATGIPLDDNTAEITEDMRIATGIENFEYSVKSGRYDL